MATCQDSWLDWSKIAPAQLKAFGDRFRAGFSHSGNDPFGVPKTATSLAGLRIAQVYPQSVGMGVGFSVVVDAGFDKTRTAMEGVLGKRLAKCEAGEGMRDCELGIADQRTFMLMAQDNMDRKTLVGCYYYYER